MSKARTEAVDLNAEGVNQDAFVLPDDGGHVELPEVEAEPIDQPADDFDETIYCELLSVLADKFAVDVKTLTGFLTPAVAADLENLIEQLVDRAFRLGEAYSTWHEAGQAIATLHAVALGD